MCLDIQKKYLFVKFPSLNILKDLYFVIAEVYFDKAFLFLFHLEDEPSVWGGCFEDV